MKVHGKQISCCYGNVRPHVAHRGNDRQMWKAAANKLNKKSWTKGRLLAWELGKDLTSLHKTLACYKMS